MGELYLTQAALVDSEFHMEILVPCAASCGKSDCAAQAQQGLRAVASLVLLPLLGKK